MALSGQVEVPSRTASAVCHSLPTSLIFAAVTAAITFFFTGFSPSASTLQRILGFLLAALGATATFRILRHGKVNTFRLLLFVGRGVLFGIAFTVNNQVNRGSILLSERNIGDGNVPICPITIPFVLPPLAIRGQMIFPASLKMLRSIVFFWWGRFSRRSASIAA